MYFLWYFSIYCRFFSSIYCGGYGSKIRCVVYIVDGIVVYIVVIIATVGIVVTFLLKKHQGSKEPSSNSP